MSPICMKQQTLNIFVILWRHMVVWPRHKSTGGTRAGARWPHTRDPERGRYGQPGGRGWAPVKKSNPCEQSSLHRWNMVRSKRGWVKEDWTGWPGSVMLPHELSFQSASLFPSFRNFHFKTQTHTTSILVYKEPPQTFFTKSLVAYICSFKGLHQPKPCQKQNKKNSQTHIIYGLTSWTYEFG